ncbi:MAG TPA: TolC family protein [Spirochaetota bacterium]|nr:TolC family protein [Spirochaetota bacterium]HPI89517.1 TolC family protein [Spirochaetota bacterium]
MKKERIILALMLGLVLFIGSRPARSENSEIRPVDIKLAEQPAVIIGGLEFSIGDAIRYAIEKNHTIIAGAYDVAMADTDFQSFASNYSPVIIGEAGGKNQKNTSSAELFYGKELSSFDGSVTLNKKFRSGTTLTTGLQHNYTESELSDLMTNPAFAEYALDHYHLPVFFVKVEQELLKNVIGYSDRRTEKITRIASDMQKDYILYMLSQVVVGVIADYWNVVTQKTKLSNADLQVQETRKVRDIIARNVRMGLLDNFNLNFYNAMVSGAEALRLEAERSYHEALRKFLTTINFETEGELTGTAILSNSFPEINSEEALKAAYEKRADYLNARRQLEIARLNLQVQKNAALPSLTAEFNAATMGQEKEAADAYEEMGKFKYTNIEGKLKVTYLIDDRAQKVSERNARFRLKQAEITLDKTRREVKDDVINKIDQINASYGMYKKMMEARREAEISYRRMLDNLRRGRLAATVLKDGLDGLIESRQRELDALIYYNISLLLFDVSKNELYEKYAIDVDKYIPRDRK